MRAHKTFSGMAKAVERLVKELENVKISNQREYEAYDRRTTALYRELNALWSNPANFSEANRLKNKLYEAWYHATN